MNFGRKRNHLAIVPVRLSSSGLALTLEAVPALGLSVAIAASGACDPSLPTGAALDAGSNGWVPLDLGVRAEPEPPRWTPCPEGWAAQTDPSGRFDTCAPWAEGGPLDWACPEGWARRGPACEPAGPFPPIAWPCPAGWRTLSRDGRPAGCDPYPSAGQASCDALSAHRPGEPGCLPIGASCPAADHRLDLPEGAPVLHVRAGAAPGGDGSTPDRALARLDQVPFETLPPRAIVALGEGEYEGLPRLERSVALFGLCPLRTALRARSESSTEGVVDVRGLDGSGVEVHLRDLRITQSPRPGLWVEAASVRLEGVVIDDVAGIGARVEAFGVLDGTDVAIRRVALSEIDGVSTSIGLLARRGAEVTLRRAALEDHALFGAAVLGAATDAESSAESRLVLEDTVIARNNQADGGGAGIALLARGAELEGRRVAWLDNRASSLSGRDGAVVALEDLAVRDTRPTSRADLFAAALLLAGAGTEAVLRRGLFVNPVVAVVVAAQARLSVSDTWASGAGNRGEGLIALSGAEAEVRRSLLEDHVSFGLASEGPGVSTSSASPIVRAYDTLIRRTAVGPDAFGHGALANAGHLEMRRAIVEDSEIVDVAAQLGGEVRLESVVLRSASQGDPSTFRIGLASTGGRIGAQGLAIRARDLAGIVAVGPGAALTVEDGVFEDVLAGVEVSGGGRVALSRFAISRYGGIGAFVLEEGSRLEARDGLILDGEGSALFPELLGMGLRVETFASALVERVAFLRTRGFAVSTFGPGTHLDLSSVVIETVVPVEIPGSELQLGAGVATSSGSARLSRVRVEDTNFGTWWTGASDIQAEDLVIRRTRGVTCSPACPFARAIAAGLALAEGSTLSARRVHVSSGPGCGLYFERSRFDLADTLVERHPVGACVNGTGSSGLRTLDQVQFREVDRLIGVIDLPRPRVAAGGLEPTPR